MPGVDRPRIKVLALNAYLSLSRLSPDLLQDGTFVQSVISRLEDGEESVSRAALETCLQLVSVRIFDCASSPEFINFSGRMVFLTRIR